MARVNVTKDPDNKHTAILDRWPTEKEKTPVLQAEIKKAHKG